MSTKTDRPDLRDGLRRRAFLSVTLAVPFLMSAPDVFAQSATESGAIDAEGFYRLSLAVIGPRADDRELAAALHAAFVAVLPGFLPKAAALATAMQAANLQTPAAFSASSLAQDPAQRAIAIGVTASWYLGHVEEDIDHGKAVAFEKALMWEPTSDIMTIPSYARGGPDYWANQTAQIEKL